MYIYTHIYILRFPRMGSMLLEIFSVSPRGFESFTRRFGSPFGAISREGVGGLRGLSRVVQGSFWVVSSE